MRGRRDKKMGTPTTAVVRNDVLDCVTGRLPSSLSCSCTASISLEFTFGNLVSLSSEDDSGED